MNEPVIDVDNGTLVWGTAVVVAPGEVDVEADVVSVGGAEVVAEMNSW